MAAIHVLEHFFEWEAVDILKEWTRILKPGGTLILELPCLDKIFEYITKCVTKHQGRYQAQMVQWAFWGDPRYQSEPMTHKWGYTMENLREKAAKAGLTKIAIGNPRYHVKVRDMRLVAQKESS